MTDPALAAGTTSRDVVKEVWIDAPPEVVFMYFTDPGRMTLWQGTDAVLDPRPGGVFRLSVLGSRAVVLGRFLEVEPPGRIVFTWGWEVPDTPVPPGSSTVEVTFEPERGGTALHLRHSGLPDAERSAHVRGWSHYLARLSIAALGADPGPDPWLRSSRRAARA